MQAIKIILAALLLATAAKAALPATTVFEVQQPASDSNGGCFDAPTATAGGGTGTDHTYPTSSPVTFTGTLAAALSTTLTDSGNGFLANMQGNCINVAGQGVFLLKTFVSSSNFTMDRLASFSGATGVVGGANATPAFACNSAVAGNQIWTKYSATAYLQTSISLNVSGGGCNLGNINTMISGYTTTRGDVGNRPTLKSTVGSATILQNSAGSGGASNLMRNLILDCNSQSANTGLHLVTGGVASNIKITGCTGGAILVAGGILTDSEVLTCGSSSCVQVSGSVVMNSEIHGSTTNCVQLQTSWSLVMSNLIYGCTGDAVNGGGYGVVLRNNTILGGSTGAGVNLTDVGHALVINNHTEANAASFGYTTSASTGASKAFLVNDAGYNNNSGNYSTGFNTAHISGFLAPSSTSFINSAGNNFGLTGASILRGAGYPATFPTGSTANSRDVGAPQSAGTTTATIGIPSGN